MDQERARTLLEEERRRLEQLQASVAAAQDRVTADIEVAEDLVDGANRRVEEETGEVMARQVDHRLLALQRAEARLAAGGYGRSVLSGRAIPDERLETFPLAELTVDEESARERTERPFVEAVERAADGQGGEDRVLERGVDLAVGGQVNGQDGFAGRLARQHRHGRGRGRRQLPAQATWNAVDRAGSAVGRAMTLTLGGTGIGQAPGLAGVASLGPDAAAHQPETTLMTPCPAPGDLASPSR
jgi:RNA polymerase-binding transcription factor DksA